MTGLAHAPRAAFAAGCLLAGCAAALAAPVNLNSQSCREFVSADPADAQTTMAWLDGYYHDEDAPPVIDPDALKANAGKLKAFCVAHPDETVGAAAESLFDRP